MGSFRATAAVSVPTSLGPARRSEAENRSQVSPRSSRTSTSKTSDWRPPGSAGSTGTRRGGARRKRNEVAGSNPQLRGGEAKRKRIGATRNPRGPQLPKERRRRGSPGAGETPPKGPPRRSTPPRGGAVRHVPHESPAQRGALPAPEVADRRGDLAPSTPGAPDPRSLAGIEEPLAHQPHDRGRSGRYETARAPPASPSGRQRYRLSRRAKASSASGPSPSGRTGASPGASHFGRPSGRPPRRTAGRLLPAAPARRALRHPTRTPEESRPPGAGRGRAAAGGRRRRGGDRRTREYRPAPRDRASGVVNTFSAFSVEPPHAAVVERIDEPSLEEERLAGGGANRLGGHRVLYGRAAVHLTRRTAAKVVAARGPGVCAAAAHRCAPRAPAP